MTTNNYKQYDEALVEKIEWILQTKKAGFTLAEIKNSLDDWYNGKLSLNAKTNIIQVKIQDIDTKINELKSVKKFLLKVLKDVEKGDC